MIWFIDLFWEYLIFWNNRLKHCINSHLHVKHLKTGSKLKKVQNPNFSIKVLKTHKGNMQNTRIYNVEMSPWDDFCAVIFGWENVSGIRVIHMYDSLFFLNHPVLNTNITKNISGVLCVVFFWWGVLKTRYITSVVRGLNSAVVFLPNINRKLHWYCCCLFFYILC